MTFKLEQDHVKFIEAIKANNYSKVNYFLNNSWFYPSFNKNEAIKTAIKYGDDKMFKLLLKNPTISKEIDFCKSKKTKLPKFFKNRFVLSEYLFDSKRILFQYQFEDIKRIVQRDYNIILNLEMGLGKTTEGLAIIKYLYNFNASE